MEKLTQEKREYDHSPQALKLKPVIDRCVFYSLDPLALSYTVWQMSKIHDALHMQRIFSVDRQSALVDVRCETYWAPRGKIKGLEIVYWAYMQERDENAGTGDDTEKSERKKRQLLRAR